MTIEQFAASYFEYNRISMGRRRLMLKMLTQFEEFTNAPVVEITPEAFREWMAYLLSQGYHVNTVRKFGNIIRTYVRHAWDQGHIPDSTYLRVGRVKNPRGATGKTKPKPYTRAEVTELLKWIDQRYRPVGHISLLRYSKGTASWNTVWHHFMRLQVRAVIMLALDCGLRRKEIHGALLNDISAENEVVLVRMGKARISDEPRYREVQYTSRARKAILEWTTARDQLGVWWVDRPFGPHLHNSPWLILAPTKNASAHTPIGSPMSMYAFEYIISPWSLHRLRHTAATMWLRAGMSLETVSRSLGHASLEQTLCYSELNRSDIVRAASRVESNFAELTGGDL